MKKQQTTANHNDTTVLWPQALAYLDHLRDRGFKPKSRQSIRYALRHFCKFMAGRERHQPTAVDGLDLESYQLNLSAQTVGTQITYQFSVRCWFGWLEETQQLFLNPAASVRLPRRPPPRLNVPTEEQMLRLLAAPNLETPSGLRDRAWLETAYATGARRLEMTRLTLADVNLQQGVLRLYGKGDKERLVPLGQQAIGWLEKYLRQARPRLLKGNQTTALWISSR